MTEAPPASTREWVLNPESEYRFELEQGTSLAIKLIQGHAEIFGAELVDGKTYLFYDECKAAVFTWQGCTIQICFTSQPSTEYISEETPMAAYANLHIAFEQMRIRALDQMKGRETGGFTPPQHGESTEPPRVLILGPENSGKTSISKILVNYAARAGQDWTPMLVNVDPGEGGSMIPGTISATPIPAPIQTSTPAHTFGNSATSTPAHMASNSLLPLGYWYGHTEMKRNPLLLDRLIRNLGENVWDRLSEDPQARASGTIVDTPSSFAASSGGGAEHHRQSLIKACVDAFRINVILVVGHEKLYVEMQRAYSARGLTVVKIPKSGGVVELDALYRARVRRAQIRAYFYGERVDSPRGLPALSGATPGSGPAAAAQANMLVAGEQPGDFTLAPASQVVSFGDLQIWRIGEETMAPQSALPIGAMRVVSEMQPLAVDPTQAGTGLYNAVLGLLAPPNPDESERYDEEILDLHVVGFVVIMAIDIANRRMTVLAPSQGSLAGRTAVVGSLEWQE